MSTTRVYLVRHGATRLTAEDRFSGDIGVDLSDDGRSQAARLGARLARRGDHRDLLQPAVARRSRPPGSSGTPSACGRRPATACARSPMGTGKGLTRREVETSFAGRVRAVVGRSVHVRAGRRRVGRRRPGSRPAGAARDCRRACRRARGGRLAQGDDPAAAQQPARVRRPRLSRSARPGAGLPQRRRLPRSRARAADAVQRHLALRRASRVRPSGACRNGGTRRCDRGGVTPWSRRRLAELKLRPTYVGVLRAGCRRAEL